MAYQYTLYEKKGHIAYITMNRPESMNALPYGAHEELTEIFHDFRDDNDSWVAIITGAGEKAFCTGNDLKATAAVAASGKVLPPSEERPPFAGLTRDFECYKPIIAAVNGYAVGGGCEIALACDIIIAAEHSVFALPEVRVGLMAGAGGLHRLTRNVPLKQAMGMILTGRRINAQEAYRIGMVNEVVPMAQLMATAEKWANEILEAAPLSVRMSKEAVMEGMGLSVNDAIWSDYERIARLRQTEDFAEGPKAFAEKRKPQWKAR